MKFFKTCISPENDNICEQVLVIIRGDALANKNVGEIISELEQQFSIIGIKSISFDEARVKQLYPGVEKQEFFPKLVSYLTTGFHFALVIEGDNAIYRMLQLKGKSPSDDQEDTLRKKFGTNDLISCVHCSDNTVAARREIKLFFKKSEIHQRNPSIDTYLEVTNTLRRSK